MVLNILEQFEDVLPIRDKEIIKTLSACAEEETLKKRQILFAAGEDTAKVYFLAHGLLRSFLLDEEGQEITDGFFWERGTFVIGGPIGEASRVNVIAMSDCRLIAFPRGVIEQLVLEDIEAMRIYNERLQRALSFHWNEKMVCHYGSATKRYQWMQKTYPEWDRLIPDKYLASYLRMSPVTLSRLRRRIREEEELNR